MNRKLETVLRDFFKSHWSLLSKRLVSEIDEDEYAIQRKLLYKNYVLKIKNIVCTN